MLLLQPSTIGGSSYPCQRKAGFFMPEKGWKEAIHG